MILAGFVPHWMCRPQAGGISKENGQSIQCKKSSCSDIAFPSPFPYSCLHCHGFEICAPAPGVPHDDCFPRLIHETAAYHRGSEFKCSAIQTTLSSTRTPIPLVAGSVDASPLSSGRFIASHSSGRRLRGDLLLVYPFHVESDAVAIMSGTEEGVP